jgi:Domain of unknown function (DUF1996)
VSRRSRGPALLVAALLIALVAVVLAAVVTRSGRQVVADVREKGAEGVVDAAPPAGLAKIKCKPEVGRAQVDPIVYHNAPLGTAVHRHVFFGNGALLGLPNPNAANLPDLLGKPTNCVQKGDTAGYWIPALVYTSGPNTGQEVPTQAFTAYYRAWNGAEFGAGAPIPQDARLVYSDDVGAVSGWSCGQNSGTGLSDAIPDCSASAGGPGDTLTAHITFPTCWNGKPPAHTNDETGDTRDNADFAYRTGNGSRAACPATHPKPVVELRETIQFTYTGPGTDVGLTSDAAAGVTDGRSMHADFWQAWDPAAFASMVKNCVNGSAATRTSAECGS